MFSKLLSTLQVLLPFIELVDDYLDGKSDTPPDLNKLKSELALERARRRAAAG